MAGTRYGGVTLATAVLIQLHTSRGRPGRDVGNLHASRKGVNIDGPGPESGAVGSRKLVHVVAQVHLQPVARLEVEVLEVKHQQFCSSRRGRWIERRCARPDGQGCAKNLNGP